MHLRKDNSVDQNHEVLSFLDWALRKAQALDYVPLPDNVIKQIESAWSTELGDALKTAVIH
jgi:phosphate transport system substrate-binding protein